MRYDDSEQAQELAQRAHDLMEEVVLPRERERPGGMAVSGGTIAELREAAREYDAQWREGCIVRSDSIQYRPDDLRAEGFAQEPALPDVMLGKLRQDGIELVAVVQPPQPWRLWIAIGAASSVLTLAAALAWFRRRQRRFDPGAPIE